MACPSRYGRHAHVPPPSLRQKAPIISPAIEEIIFTALAKDPTKRFVNVSAFITALEQAQKPGNAPRPARPILPPANQLNADTTMPPRSGPTPFPPQQSPISPVAQQPMQVHYPPPAPATPLPVQNVQPIQAIAPTSKPIARPKKAGNDHDATCVCNGLHGPGTRRGCRWLAGSFQAIIPYHSWREMLDRCK